MGQPQQDVIKSAGEVDIDNIEVEILIIARDASKLKTTAAFLTRRGWPTLAITDVQKAVTHISQKRPDFILLAVDHPSSAMAKLPDLIAKSFAIECIAYAEGSGTAASQKLNNSRLPIKVFGSPSGPNVQRVIRRLLAEKFNVKPEESAPPEPPKDYGGSVTISGDSSAAQLATNVVKGDYANEVISNGKYRIGQPGERKSLKELTGAPIPQARETTPEAAEELAAKAEALIAELGPESLELPDPRESESETSASSEARASAPPAARHLPRSKREKMGAAHIVSELEKAVTAAMDLFASRGPSDGEPLPLEATGRVAVFPFDSNSTPGYLVVAMQYSDLIDEKYVIDNIHSELADTFRERNIDAKVESGFAVDLPFVQFKSWADDNSAFWFCPTYYSYEFGVAFFKAEKTLPKARALEESNMFGIDVKAISTDEPVNFKAYLYLKQNQKYFLYLRDGRVLQPEQKNRLLGNQVDNFYMKAPDLDNLRVFLAGNYLRGSMKKKSG